MSTVEQTVEQAADSLLRDILESLCLRDGLPLDSPVAPGKPAANYELADRLGIGHVFGLRVTESRAAALEQVIAAAERQGWTVTRTPAPSFRFQKGTITVYAQVRIPQDLVTLANGLREMGLTLPASARAGLTQTQPGHAERQQS